jgi:hypothetical protein
VLLISGCCALVVIDAVRSAISCDHFLDRAERVALFGKEFQVLTGLDTRGQPPRARVAPRVLGRASLHRAEHQPEDDDLRAGVTTGAQASDQFANGRAVVQPEQLGGGLVAEMLVEQELVARQALGDEDRRTLGRCLGVSALVKNHYGPTRVRLTGGQVVAGSNPVSPTKENHV